MNALHVLRVPTSVTHQEPGRARWCFNCRTRNVGTYSLHVPTDPMSYYGPHWSYTCDNCGEDGRLGFGDGWLDGGPGPSESDRASRAKPERASKSCQLMEGKGS